MTSPIFNQTIELAGPTLVESPYSPIPVEDWEVLLYTELDFKVSVQPESSTEGPVERPQVITGWVLITPPGTDIPELKPSSRIRLGKTLLMDVVGRPARWPDPWNPGKVHHLEAKLEVVDG